MAKTKKVEAVEAVEAVAPVEGKKEVVKSEAISHEVFMVFDAKGDFVREYTVEASGEKAGEMAAVFAEELGGFVK